MSLNLDTIKTVDTQPFRYLVSTIGNLPTSFTDSMSYYELLAWFLKFLEDEVIPTVNNNAAAVEELQGIVIELHDYVENYFANLDVQEEINNKLDDMAAEGTLQAIITAYLQIAGVLSFDSVSAMKASTNLIEGSVAKTTGFYSAGDIGGATYNIRAKTELDTPNEIDLFDLYDNTLVAELVYESEMNVKQFGAKGDGSTDDTAVIQYAVSHCSNVYVPDGTYMIDTHYDTTYKSGITMPSNSKLSMSENATLKAIANNYLNYYMIDIRGVHDVIIEGGNILGDKDTHTGEEGEWGHGIYIRLNSYNIKIKDVKITKTWGDGITITGASNVETQNLIIDGCRRNGYTVADGVNVHSLNDTILNTSGTNPQSGVDIEPNDNNGNVSNIVFDNLTTKNNSGNGFMVQLRGMDNSKTISIKVNNHHDYGSGSALTISKSATTVGTILIDHPFYDSSQLSGIKLNRCYASNCNVVINRPVILNCDTSGNTSRVYASAIVSALSSGQDILPMGNIEIIEPYTTNATNAIDTIMWFDNETESYQDVKIINPLNNDNGRYIRCNNGPIYLEDKYDQLIYQFTSSTSLNKNQRFGTYTNTNASANIRETIPDTFEVGRVLKFVNTNTNDPFKTFRFQVAATEYIPQLSENANITVTLANLGDSITIKKQNATQWIVLEKNCDPTVS